MHWQHGTLTLPRFIPHRAMGVIIADGQHRTTVLILLETGYAKGRAACAFGHMKDWPSEARRLLRYTSSQETARLRSPNVGN
jgi:hypothetical protein